MKSRIQVINELVKKYSDDYQLGSIVRKYMCDEYWKPDINIKWLKRLSDK